VRGVRSTDVVLCIFYLLYCKLDHGCTSILLCPHRIIILALLTVGLFTLPSSTSSSVVVLFAVAFGVPAPTSTAMMERRLDLIIFSLAHSEDGLTLSPTGLGLLFV
jgi:hypothetical protein